MVSSRGYAVVSGLVKSGFAAALGLWLAFGLMINTAAAQDKPKLLALGDSLTAGFGLPREQAFPVRLEAWLHERGVNVAVINAGVSGDTAAGGLARLDWSLADQPRYALVELGANDALRGLPADALEKSLDEILRRLTARNIKVLLAGMYAPRNYGADYAREFDAVYPRLAAKYNAAFYPFFLDGVAGDPALNQGDMLHPNERGVAVLVDRLGPIVKRMIDGG